MPKPSPIQRALAKFDDSPTKMALALGGGVLRQHVEHWVKSSRVPTEHCRRIHELTGVPCWDFRPDDWFRIWPDLIGASGAPRIPGDVAKGVAQLKDRPAANGKPKKQRRDTPADTGERRRKTDKPQARATPPSKETNHV